MYDHGAKGFFDVAAVHPYTGRYQGVLTLARRMRKQLDDHGDQRKHLIVTEMGWSSGLGVSTYNYGWETTEEGQARDVRQAVPYLAARRNELKLDGIYWYTWMSPPLGKPNSFAYTGLRRMGADGVPVDKPALAAWRETVAQLVR